LATTLIPDAVKDDCAGAIYTALSHGAARAALWLFGSSTEQLGPRRLASSKKSRAAARTSPLVLAASLWLLALLDYFEEHRRRLTRTDLTTFFLQQNKAWLLFLRHNMLWILLV